MPKTLRKKLLIHMDKFAGSGPVTEEQIRSCVEQVLGTAAANQIKLLPIRRKKDGEIISIQIHFGENVDNTDIEKIRQCILILAGVLEGGVSEQFPIQLSCSDDMESYSVDQDIIVASAGKWQLTALDNTAQPTPRDQLDFNATDSPVGEGIRAGNLVMSKDSSNLFGRLVARCTAPSDGKKLKIEIMMEVKKDPVLGTVEIALVKGDSSLAILRFVGSRVFPVGDVLEPDNNKVILISHVPGDPGVLTVKKVVANTRYGQLYRWILVFDTPGLQFDSFFAADDGQDCSFDRDLEDLSGGIDASDLTSGTLGVRVQLLKSPPGPVSNPDSDCLAARDTDIPSEIFVEGFTLGTSFSPYGSHIILNTEPAGDGWDDASNSPFGRITCDGLDKYWDPATLAAFTIEMRLTREASRAAGSGVIALSKSSRDNNADTTSMIGGLELNHNRNSQRWFLRYHQVTRRDHNLAMNDPTLPIENGTWFHILVQWDGTNLEFYRDGKLLGRTALTGLTAFNPSFNRMNVGHVWDNLGLVRTFQKNNGWSGNIDEFRMSKIARFASPTNVGDESSTWASYASNSAGSAPAPHVSDDDTLKLLNLDEASVAASEPTAALNDSGPLGETTVDDLDVVIDEINVTAEG